MNRKQLGFELDINHFTDLTEEEFKNHRGTLYDDQAGRNEYEKRIPICDENFELKDKNVEKHVEKEGNRNKTRMRFENNERGLSMKDLLPNAAETDRKVSKGSYAEENKNDKIAKKSNRIDGNENNGKVLQRATYFDYASKSKAIQAINLTTRNKKKSEIAGKSFETEMKELEMLGEQLNELSEQLSTKSVTKESKVERENAGRQNIASYHERMSTKNETYPRGNISKWDETYENTNAKGKIIIHNTTSNGLTNNEKEIGKPIVSDVAFTKTDKLETEKSVKRQHLESSFNGDGPSRKSLLTRADIKRRKPHATIHKVKKRIKMPKERESLFDNAKNYQPLDQEEIFNSFDNEMVKQMSEDRIDDFYTPDFRIRKIKNNDIDRPFPSEEENNNEKNKIARRRSFQKIYTDYNSFEKTWRKPTSANVHPFFMFGVDHRQSGANQAETLEYDFTMNDNYRFPEKFQTQRKKDKHKKKHLRQQKNRKRKRKKTKIPAELDWRDYGKMSQLF